MECQNGMMQVINVFMKDLTWVHVQMEWCEAVEWVKKEHVGDKEGAVKEPPCNIIPC